ncbi:MAG: hypothetical protein JST85_00500 [Acidobacteria bacterium]|nr:hypothetical protein [Acidobacteriota bacterium]
MKLITQNSHLWLFATGATARNRRWIAACAILATATLYAAWFHPSRAQAEQTATLRGRAAVRQLKADGGYDSLSAAVAVARDQSISANNYIQQQKVTASDGAAKDALGWSIALDGDTAIVGAPSDDIGQVANQGSAYVFTRSGGVWTQQQRLIANDGAADDYFGNSVAISGDTVVVCAFLDDIVANANQGSVYVFVRSGGVWTQQQKLTANDGGASEYFGTAVAINRDTVVVGAEFDNIGMNSVQGSAYVFTRSGNNWTQKQKLTASDGVANDHFGSSVAMSDETIVVGAEYDRIGVPGIVGSAYVFARSGGGWVQQQRLNPIDPAAAQGFGFSVALSGQTIVVGVLDDNSYTPGSEGSAYVFIRNNGMWTQQQKLIANDGAFHNYFSTSVAISGEAIAVGAFYDTVGKNAEQGDVFVYARSGAVWTQQQKLTANDGDAEDNFGVTVAMSGDTLAVGTQRDDIGENADQGSAYIFRANKPSLITPVSAASFAGTALASESIVAAFGGGLSESIEIAATQPLPTTLAGTRVRVRDNQGAESFAPLFFASPNQINFQLPSGVAIGKAAITVLRGNETVATGEAQIESVAPGLFSADSSGQGLLMGLALRIRADGSQSYEPITNYDAKTKQFIAAPIDLGSATDRVYLILFATGVRNRSSLSNVVMKIGGLSADALYAGPQGTFAGLDQLNVLLSRNLVGRGEVDVAVLVNGKQANTLKIAIK